MLKSSSITRIPDGESPVGGVTTKCIGKCATWPVGKDRNDQAAHATRAAAIAKPITTIRTLGDLNALFGVAATWPAAGSGMAKCPQSIVTRRPNLVRSATVDRGPSPGTW